MSVYQTPTGTWYCQYRVTGQKSPVKEYFGQGPKGKRLAEIRAAEIKLLRTQGKDVKATAKLYLDQLAQFYLDDAKTRGKSAKWRKEFADRLNKDILPYLSGRPVDQLEYNDILVMVEAWGKSVATTNRYLGYLRAVFRYGVDQEVINRNPMAKWRKAKEKTKHHVCLTVLDLRRLIVVADPHIAWALEVAWMTGARPGPTELYLLRYDDVDHTALTIHVRGSKTATSDRLVPISREESLRLLEMEQASCSGYIVEYKGRPVRQMQHGLKTAAARAELKYNVRWYDVRHLYASELIRQGADLAAVSAMLGHSDITTTQRRYYHLLAGERRRAASLKPQIRPPREGKLVKIR